MFKLSLCIRCQKEQNSCCQFYCFVTISSTHEEPFNLMDEVRVYLCYFRVVTVRFAIRNLKSCCYQSTLKSCWVAQITDVFTEWVLPNPRTKVPADLWTDYQSLSQHYVWSGATGGAPLEDVRADTGWLEELYFRALAVHMNHNKDSRCLFLSHTDVQ